MTKVSSYGLYKATIPHLQKKPRLINKVYKKAGYKIKMNTVMK